MNKRVLIIEDDETQCEALRRLLRRREIHTECRHTFDEGIAEAHAVTYDLIMLDLVLPDSPDALETFRRSTTELRSTPVIPWTGIEDPDLIAAFQKAKRPFILKGTPTNAIMKAILTELEWQEPSKELEQGIISEHQELVQETAPARITPIQRIMMWCAVVSAVFIVGAAVANGYHSLVGSGENTARLEARLKDGEKEPARAQEAEKEILKLIGNLQEEQKQEQKRIDARLTLNDTRDQRSEDDRLALHGQVDGIKTVMEANKTEWVARFNRVDDKMDRALEALGQLRGGGSGKSH